MDNLKYYFAKRKTDKTYPLVDILNMSQVELGNAEKLEVRIGDPVPRNLVMADYLSGAKDIFHKRIAGVMENKGMDGVTFIPVKLDDTKGNWYDDYVCVVVDGNTYEAMDKEESEYELLTDDDDDDVDYEIEKIVLDRKVLEAIPLNKRLAFRLREAPGYYLYHQSVVDAIMELDPTGIYFQDIEEYEF